MSEHGATVIPGSRQPGDHDWRPVVAPYQRAEVWRALLQLATTLLPLVCVFWALLTKFATLMPEGGFSMPLELMGIAGMQINAVIMVLNLLPVPPLDGGRIAVSLLPRELSYQYAKIEPSGMMILVLMLFTRMLDRVIGPFTDGTVNAVGRFFGI